jgi:3-isopropylmalate/(R)-2-methylmalate dehydratase small subunit
MKKFVKHKGIVLPLLSDNIDTDQIIPSREMKTVSKFGLADGLFSGQRYLYEGKQKKGLNPDFILNQHGFEQATILLSLKNFGCGSSREHAVWALVEYGFRVIIAESFGSIFRNNCLRNGLVPITLPATQIAALVDLYNAKSTASTLQIDLTQKRVVTKSVVNKTAQTFSFDIEDYSQKMLINGWDFIDLTLQFRQQINDFKQADQQTRPRAHI